MQRPSFAIAILLFPILATACLFGPSAAASNSEGMRLALLKPANQWMKQGTTDRIAVIVERTGFRDAVEVKFLNLPKGVKVEDPSIPEGTSAKDFILVAAPDAEIVADHAVTIEVRSHGLMTSQPFQISVKAK
jgi:hypothetical protein